VVCKTGIRFLGQKFARAIGVGLVTDFKQEGDGATPKGTHKIVGCLYRPDRLKCPNNWASPIYPTDCWSDDPSDPAYNSLVQSPYTFTHETLRRADPLYDLILLTDWNWPVSIPGRGSAIFLHQWRKARHPTQGCVAVSRQNLYWIAQRITQGTRLIVA